MLFNDDNSDLVKEIKINLNYAKGYANLRQKEELNKLKTKYDEELTTDNSSSSDDEDEDTENPEFDREFYKTLAYLKKKDPCIYDKNIKFFDNINTSEKIEHNESEKIGEKLKKNKALALCNSEEKIVEGNEQFNSNKNNTKKNVAIKTHASMEKEQKNSFTYQTEESEDKDDNTGFTNAIQNTDEGEKLYKKWLKGEQSNIDLRKQEELKPLYDCWADPNLDENEKFLRDYVLNSKYIDNDFFNTEPDYGEVAHDSDNNLSDDEENIKKQEEFEHKYNFRFEEPDDEFIKRYPRTMKNSIRKKDTRKEKRAQKRKEVKERKEEKKQEKREELKKLKVLKRKEIEEKIEQLKKITGNDDMCFDTVNFDADFDANEHDKKMDELFNKEYYDTKDDVKPEFPDMDEELEIENTWDDYDPNVNEIYMEDASHEGPHCEDADFNMDADYDGSQNLQSELKSTQKKKRRRRTKFAMMIEKEKPKFDPKQFPSFKEYFDKYYSLDYEDMIGDMPCRFKYRKVVPNDYGLSVEEILTADDEDLEKWCKLKQVTGYKSEDVEIQDVQSYKQRSSNEKFKQKVLKSLYKPEEKDESTSAENQTTNNKKERRKRKKIKNNNFDANSVNTNIVSEGRIMESVENNIQNNYHDIKKNVKENKNVEENTANKSQKRKRKNKLRVDSDGPRPKMIKTDDVQESSPVKTDKMEKDNEKTIPMDKIMVNEKKKNNRKKMKKLQLNGVKSGKHKSNKDNIDPIMSLNEERLKTYGINAKKFKNKLKYGNKKF